MSSLPGLRRLARALDESRTVEHELDQHDQVEDAKQLDRLTDELERSPAVGVRT
jgi:hypothetical protein